jgi:phosphate transport system permease protein
MHAPQKDDSLTRTHAAAGEPFVWLTAMGLTIGLLMVVGLLGIILANGVPVFWPKKVYEVTLKAGIKNPVPGGGESFAGELVQTRTKRVPVLTATGELETDQKELQYFVGNKDVYGINFAFVSRVNVQELDLPKDIYAIERMEYGDAFVYLMDLTLADGTKIEAAGNPDFSASLAAAVKISNSLRDKIGHIEKNQIGRINSQINDLKVKGGGSPDSLAKIAGLEAHYETLATEARTLRQQQQSTTLTFRAPNGTVKTQPISEVVGFYQPNNMGLVQKTGVFLHNIWSFLSGQPREANTEGGIFPAIFGTFVMTLLMSIAVVPFGVLAAIYMREYAKQGILVRSVRIAVNNLAGVPSIVFGVFGLGFFVYFVGGGLDRWLFSDYLPTPTFGTGGILWASLTLALMTVPVVIVATEEAIAAVPRGMKEGSLACGASKWQTIQRIVLPASVPGILTGLILAMARGAGEVAPLMLVGVVKLAPSLPVDGEFPFIHLERKFMHLGFHIYDLGFQSPDSEAAKPMVFATTLLLIVLVVLLNITAIFIRERLRKKFATGAF